MAFRLIIGFVMDHTVQMFEKLFQVFLKLPCMSIGPINNGCSCVDFLIGQIERNFVSLSHCSEQCHV